MNSENIVKVLFIIPPNISFFEFINVDERSSLRYIKDTSGASIKVNDIRTEMPLGVLELSAYLKKHCNKNIKISLLDFNIILNKKISLIFQIIWKYMLVN